MLFFVYATGILMFTMLKLCTTTHVNMCTALRIQQNKAAILETLGELRLVFTYETALQTLLVLRMVQLLQLVLLLHPLHCLQQHQQSALVRPDLSVLR